MKRGAIEHPKTYTLAAVLNIPRYAAVGVLESLWHFAQRYAPAGDVGRHSDDAIARGIGWDGNAATLVSGLAQAGWVDRCSCHRVRIHDWHTHADQTTKRSIEGRFLHCYEDPTVVLAKASESIASASGKLAAVAVPSRAVAVPEPKPEPVTAAAVALAPRAWSAEAIDDHRELRGEPVAGKLLGALKPLVDRHTWEIVRPVFRRWLESDEGKFGPHKFAENFVALSSPRARAPTRATVGSQTADVIREIARREGRT